jgi:hypothetical protein
MPDHDVIIPPQEAARRRRFLRLGVFDTDLKKAVDDANERIERWYRDTTDLSYIFITVKNDRIRYALGNLCSKAGWVVSYGKESVDLKQPPTRKETWTVIGCGMVFFVLLFGTLIGMGFLKAWLGGP